MFQWHCWMLWRLYVSRHIRSLSIISGPRTPQGAHRVERQTTSQTKWDGKPKYHCKSNITHRLVNSLVIREKGNGWLRLCLDPKDLNKVIKREHHPIPSLEEITPKLEGAKLLSKPDAHNGYWNVKLEEESSYLTTFNTPFGWYRFLRMLFGLQMSQDIV